MNFSKIYFQLLLEETINNIQTQKIPSPFSELLVGLKNAMSKAIDAVSSQLIQINKEVNVWRDKLVSAWTKFSNTLTNQQKTKINDILIDLTTKYTDYMHGFNTGY